MRAEAISRVNLGTLGTEVSFRLARPLCLDHGQNRGASHHTLLSLAVIGCHWLSLAVIGCRARGAAGAPATFRSFLRVCPGPSGRSEEHTSELQSLMRISYAVFCLKHTTNYIS